MCDEAPRKTALGSPEHQAADNWPQQRLARREEVRQILAAPLARPVPEVGAGMIRSDDDEAWARRTMTPICRALRVDPDGPHEPMQPREYWEAMRRPVYAAMEAQMAREDRDAALIRALRFT